MALPGHRRTRSHKKRRAAHFALKKSITTKCSNCDKSIIPHHLCPHCGYYKGRQVLILKIKKGKK